MPVRKGQVNFLGGNPQLNLFYKKIVDNFAGGGGASTGIEMAVGRPVDAAINHDPAAILLHKTNHPHTIHYQEDVFAIDPYEVSGGHDIGLAWFSPTCTHFSRAKGLPLVDRHIRGLAWVTLRWAMTVRPDCIMLENVVEFQTWGPLMPDPKGRGEVPDPAHKGETFQGFVEMLSTGCKKRTPAFYEACEFLDLNPDGADARRLLNGLGYELEYRELNAADYGVPTTRTRFFMVARADGQPIVWPEPTHANRKSAEAKSGKKKEWRGAYEIIDWSKPMPSIFDTKEQIKNKYGISAQRPLRPNTMRRVARGLDKFVLKTDSPFIIPAPFAMQEYYHEAATMAPNMVNICHEGEFRGGSVTQPLPTILGKNSFGVETPILTPWTCTNTSNSTGAPVNEPVHTVTSAGNQMLIGTYLAHYHTEQSKESVRGQSLKDPLATIDTSNRHGLCVASLAKYYSNDYGGASLREPMPTVLSKDHMGLQMAHLMKYYGGVVGSDLRQPLPTVTAIDHNALVRTHVEPIGNSSVDLQHWPEVRALLNEHCGYNLADDEILILDIDGGQYFIADVCLRMLDAKELYAANGFPPDYVIDHDYMGNKYRKADQVAKCGNSVPPMLATAMVKVNFPRWCEHSVTTMRELEDQIAV